MFTLLSVFQFEPEQWQMQIRGKDRWLSIWVFRAADHRTPLSPYNGTDSYKNHAKEFVGSFLHEVTDIWNVKIPAEHFNLVKRLESNHKGNQMLGTFLLLISCFRLSSQPRSEFRVSGNKSTGSHPREHHYVMPPSRNSRDLMLEDCCLRSGAFGIRYGTRMSGLAHTPKRGSRNGPFFALVRLAYRWNQGY